MSSLLPNVDSDGLLEYSVVFSDRSLNHMSKSFQKVMTDTSKLLKSVYNSDASIIVPGGGTYAMEAVARQYSTNKKCLLVRNGWFNFRFTQIFAMANIPSTEIVHKAIRISNDYQAGFAPAPIDEVVNSIKTNKPDFVFATHVETSAGIILPDDYIKQLANAVHSIGGMLVLDCVASGAIWVDMKDLGIDILIGAPQKGWSSPAAFGFVLLSKNAKEAIKSTKSTSYSCDLLKWLEIMQAYENGGHAYHITMPTDAIKKFRDVILETKEFGIEKAKIKQKELGDKMRVMVELKGIKSVAAKGFKAPSVIVSYTDDKNIHNGSKFAALGVQVAAGVPLECDEGDNYQSFRIGLFGLDKLKDVDGTLKSFKQVLDKIEIT